MKNYFPLAMKLLFMAFFINLLVGCSTGDWLFGTPPTASNPGGTTGAAGGFLSMLGGIVGGPIGYVVTGLGAAAGPLYKWLKHDRSSSGLIQGIQRSRSKLPQEARDLFDAEMRDFMDHTYKGDLRGYVRDKKSALRKSGKMALDNLSNKHTLKKLAMDIFEKNIHKDPTPPSRINTV